MIRFRYLNIKLVMDFCFALIYNLNIVKLQEENVKACLPPDPTDAQYASKDTELIVALSLSIAFILIELTTFGSGLTMFSSFTTVYCKLIIVLLNDSS